MNIFDNMVELGVIHDMRLDYLKRAETILVSLAKTEYLEYIYNVLDGRAIGDDLNAEVYHIMESELNASLQIIGITLMNPKLSIMIDLFESLDKFIKSDEYVKDDIKVHITNATSNVEIANCVLLPFTLLIVDELEFIVESVDDSFVNFIELVLSSSSIEDVHEIYEINKVSKWLVKKLNATIDVADSITDVMNKFFGLPLDDILSMYKQELTLNSVVMLLMASEDGRADPVTIGNRLLPRQSDEQSRIMDAAIKIVGEYND